MKKISVIIFLCLIAVLIREVIYLGIGSYFGSLLVNLLGSIIFIVVKGSIKLTSKQQSIFNIVFLGSLTTYSGVYKVMFDLIGNEMYLNNLPYIYKEDKWG
ncbi:MAG: hypothetical protein RR585_05320 [Coprobacillus sp.]